MKTTKTRLLSAFFAILLFAFGARVAQPTFAAGTTDLEIRIGNVMGVQLGDLAFRQLAGELAHHEALELNADVEGVARFLPARRRHHGDAVAAQLDQAFGGELPQRMAASVSSAPGAGRNF